MLKKTIVLSAITLVSTDEANAVPFKYDARGAVLEGRLAQIYNPPGTPVTLDAGEADSLLARFGGHEIDSGTGEVVRTIGPPLHSGIARAGGHA